MKAPIEGIDSVSARMGSAFSPVSRSVLTAALLAFLIGQTYLKGAILGQPNIDERGWVDRSLKPLWPKTSSENYHLQYLYARHHPAFARIVYGMVLRGIGVTELDEKKVPLVNYELSWKENIALGATVPPEVRTALRLTNAGFLAGMIAFLYLGFKRIFANRALSILGCVPVLFSYPLYDYTCPYPGVARYTGADSMLLFWLAAFWYTWLVAAKRGIWGVIAMGLVGGLMVSTKTNGAFGLLGACIFLAVAARGARRILYPLLVGGLAFAVFIALNPVYRAGDIAWMVQVFRDTVALLFKLKEKTAGRNWGTFTRWEVLRFTFPFWFFAVPASAIIVKARREKWFAPTVAWALPTIFLNWLLIYVPFPRYAAPIVTAFWVLFGVAAIHFLRELYRARSAPKGAR